MKTLIILFLVFSFEKADTNQTLDTIIQTEFCEGWEAGYCEGWEYIKGQYSRCPRKPRCPRPKLYQNEYNDGYNRAFELGKLHAIED
tara:strand:+ start:132 stop:392 length:261 start_codon:yes stop_codon:yes gene_type:complete